MNVNVGTPQSNDYIVIGDKKIYGQKQPGGTTYYPVPQDPESQRIIQERLRNLGIEKPREEIKEARLQGAYLRKHSKFEESIFGYYVFCGIFPTKYNTPFYKYFLGFTFMGFFSNNI